MVKISLLALDVNMASVWIPAIVSIITLAVNLMFYIDEKIVKVLEEIYQSVKKKKATDRRK